MRHFASYGAVLAIAVAVWTGGPTRARGETICYFQTTSGQELDLSRLCGASEQATLAQLDERFLNLLANMADGDSIQSLKSAEQKTLVLWGQQICWALKDGRTLETIRQPGTGMYLAPSFVFSVKTAAIGMYCPQYTRLLTQDRDRQRAEN